MTRRALKVLVACGRMMVAAIATWLLSWLVQFICFLAAESSFSLVNRPVNRLAVATVVVVFVLVAFVELAVNIKGKELLLLWLGTSYCGIIAVPWLSGQVFSETPVYPLVAQIIYGAIVTIWSLALWYVFFDPE